MAWHKEHKLSDETWWIQRYAISQCTILNSCLSISMTSIPLSITTLIVVNTFKAFKELQCKLMVDFFFAYNDTHSFLLSRLIIKGIFREIQCRVGLSVIHVRIKWLDFSCKVVPRDFCDHVILVFLNETSVLINSWFLAFLTVNHIYWRIILSSFVTQRFSVCLPLSSRLISSGTHDVYPTRFDHKNDSSKDFHF